MAGALSEESAGTDKPTVNVEGRELRLSNLTKVLYPETGFTKGQVIDYYLRISPVLLPHVANRPLTVRRFPNGVDGESFYEKHRPRGTPEWVKSVRVLASPNARDRNGVEFVVLSELATLIWAANLASLELHVPQWRVNRAGKPQPPDLLVFDLDPGEGADMAHCAEVALLLAEELRNDHGWTAHPKASGSKGLQLYVPLPKAERQKSWDDGGTARAGAGGRRGAQPAPARPRGGQHAQGPAPGAGPHRLEPEPRGQDDRGALLAAGPRGPHRVDPGHLGRGRAGGRRRQGRTPALPPPQVLERVAELGDLFAPLVT